MNTPALLRRELQLDQSDLMRWRRGVIGWSLVGMASMGVVSLFQAGLIRHLPDPPLPGFRSDQVNSSDTAYALGVPDGTVSLASLAANVPLASCGGADRSRRKPWLPLSFAAKTGVEAMVATWYFLQMPLKEKAWCAYCITGAVANWAVFLSSLPEARAAWRSQMQED
jgi:hypothetical protein